MGFVHEHVFLPIGDLLRGERVHRFLRLMREAEQWSEERMLDFQTARMKVLVNCAAKEVPFYRDWFAEKGLDPQKIASLHDLGSLPIVDKTLMRKEGLERFASQGFPLGQRLELRSSGSTGEPFSFYVSKEAYSANLAAKLLTWYHAGYRLGDRYMKIAYMPRHGWKKKLQDKLNNCEYIYFNSINIDNSKRINDLIEYKKPFYVRSYPMSLFLLAQYRLEHPSYTHCPRYMMTTGAVLSSKEREIIEKAFGCDVIDSYSCEGNPNNAETPAHDGYHTCRYYGIVEVLDDNNRPVSNGIGRVVSTDLWNLAYPFIRYDTQDMVEVKEGVIVRVIGRQSESVTSASGTIFTIYSFMSFFEHETEAVDAYQVVKRKDGSVLFRLVVNEKYNSEEENRIIGHWQERIEAPVGVEVVDTIPLMHNNKRLSIIDE